MTAAQSFPLTTLALIGLAVVVAGVLWDNWLRDRRTPEERLYKVVSELKELSERQEKKLKEWEELLDELETDEKNTPRRNREA